LTCSKSPEARIFHTDCFRLTKSKLLTLSPSYIWQLGHRSCPQANGPRALCDISVLATHTKQWARRGRDPTKNAAVSVEKDQGEDREQKCDVSVRNDRAAAHTAALQRAYIGKQRREAQVDIGADSQDLEMNTSDIIGLLKRLPFELSQLVASYCPDSILWRYRAAAAWPPQDFSQRTPVTPFRDLPGITAIELTNYSKLGLIS
jgi:hypothetical protein